MRRVILAWNLIATAGFVALILAQHPWLAVAVLFSGHALWLIATLAPGCGWWGRVEKRLPVGDNAVWLTIDDGPDPEDTPELLKLLDRHDAKATFFLIGDKARRHPDLVRLIYERGHGIGNHTLTHPAGWFWSRGPGSVRREIEECSRVLRESEPRARIDWFRAPAGLRNHWVHPVLELYGLRLAGWSARGFDGVDQDAGRILERLKRSIKPGAIVLLHEARTDGEGRRLAPQVLGELLEWLKAAGLRPVLPRAEDFVAREV